MSIPLLAARFSWPSSFHLCFSHALFLLDIDMAIGISGKHSSLLPLGHSSPFAPLPRASLFLSFFLSPGPLPPVLIYMGAIDPPLAHVRYG